MKYFAGINNLDDLKKLYKKLALANHPDRGGKLEVMQEINAEYDKAFKSIQDGSTDEKVRAEAPEEFKDIINKIINFAGIDIEICGLWIWVSGNTYIYRAELKAAGFMWASKKMMWYWRPEEAACKGSKKTTIEYIREKYGSEKILSSAKYAIA